MNRRVTLRCKGGCVGCNVNKIEIKIAIVCGENKTFESLLLKDIKKKKLGYARLGLNSFLFAICFRPEFPSPVCDVITFAVARPVGVTSSRKLASSFKQLVAAT